MKFALAAAALLAAAAPAAAQTASGPADPKINQLIVYGDDPCPASTDDVITVCARRGEDDRFRIPENLRNSDRPENNSWVNKAIELSYVGRTGIQSCTPSGPGGASGCFAQLASQYRAERGGRDSVNWNRLIETARQERLGKIDEQAEEDERRARGEE
ncbi:MAG TPA: hypothetical protein VF628_02945 [Allosphingosinicella sp.]|jgi:hypothetical protein